MSATVAPTAWFRAWVRENPDATAEEAFIAGWSAKEKDDRGLFPSGSRKCTRDVGGGWGCCLERHHAGPCKPQSAHGPDYL